MDYRNTLGFWMHPLLTALATNPAYYYYYTAKADLFNQSIMVRRGSQRVSKKIHSSISTQSSHDVAALPFGTLGGTGINPNQILRQHGIAACPQCQTQFNGTNCRPVQEACGHIKCRKCFISNDERCPQCRDAERPRRNASVSLVGTSKRVLDVPGSRIEELDIMPPLLTVEEPLGASVPSSSARDDVVPVKELPPLLSSVVVDSKSPKATRKRKQSTEFSLEASIPTKIKKSTNGETPVPKVSYPRERSKSRRHSSTICSKGDQRESSLPKPSRYCRVVSHDSEPNSASTNGEEVFNQRIAGKKRNSRAEVKSNCNIIPRSQHNNPLNIAPDLTAKPQQKGKSTRLSTLRSSACTTFETFTSIQKSQYSPQPREPSPHAQILAKPQLCLSRQEIKDHKAPSFEITISPTTIKPSKFSTPSSPIVTSCPASIPSKATGKGDETAISLSRSVSCSTLDGTLPRGSSSEGSNSNSLETCDPLYIKDDRIDSNSTENKTRKLEAKKKKKRNPVTIHDHITILSGDPPLYQCNVCMKKFKTKAHIKYHEFCQNGEKPFKCEQCGQGFIAKSHYEYHLRTHTGERPYVCPKCGKGFNQRGKVTRHMRSHTGEKPFICQQCGRGFANAQALRSHFLIHTGERPFACQYCNKRFTGMTNLKKHVITHTGERPFSCTHCGKSFGLKWTLDLHLRTHSTERPFACDQCTRAFSNSKDLRRHLVIHSGERPFKCWICGTAFRRKDNLDRHIKNTHNQPKEVAKQLANEAAAEYMALSKQTQANPLAKGLVAKRIGHTFMPSSSSKGSAMGSKSSTSRGTSKKIDKKIPKKSLSENVDVIITADLSPPSSPNQIGADACDVYLLPNGQADILQGNLLRDLTCVEPKVEADSQIVKINEYDGLAELRTVPVNEYHKVDGIKMLDIAKSGTDTSGTNSMKLLPKEPDQTTVTVEKDVKPVLEESELYCATPEGSTKGKLFSPGLTVTVIYENDGTTHFIQQPSSYPTGEDPLSFPEDRTNVLTINKNMLFGFGHGDNDSSRVPLEIENNAREPSQPLNKKWDILSKKCETILSGNLSKFLEYDVHKNCEFYNDSSAIIDVNSGLNGNEPRVEPKLLVSNIPINGNPSIGSSSLYETEENSKNKTKESVLANSAHCIVLENLGSSKNLDIGGVKSNEGTDGGTKGSLIFQDLKETSESLPLGITAECFEQLNRSFCKQRFAVKEVELLSLVSNERDACKFGDKNEGSVDSVLPCRASEKTEEKDNQMGELSYTLNRSINCNNESFGFTRYKVVSDTRMEAAESLVQEGFENYRNDPMLQDRITDDDYQRNTDDRLQSLELSHDHDNKESVDSILPEGMEEHYVSHEAIFHNDIVETTHKLEDNSQTIRHLEDIVDKECPVSILQDDGSNCGSVDPVCGDDNDDFNDVNYSVSSKCQIQKPKQRNNIDAECPELILASENENIACGKTNEFCEFNLIQKSRVQSHRDSDMESVSSTELEHDLQETVSKCLEVCNTKTCPTSIIESCHITSDIVSEGIVNAEHRESKHYAIDKDQYLSNSFRPLIETTLAPPGQKNNICIISCLASSKVSCTTEQDMRNESVAFNEKPANKRLSKFVEDEELTIMHQCNEAIAETVRDDKAPRLRDFTPREAGFIDAMGKDCMFNFSQNVNIADDVEPISDTELEDLDDPHLNENLGSNQNVSVSVMENYSVNNLLNSCLFNSQREDLLTHLPVNNVNICSVTNNGLMAPKQLSESIGFDKSAEFYLKRTKEVCKESECSQREELSESSGRGDLSSSSHEEGEIFSPNPFAKEGSIAKVDELIGALKAANPEPIKEETMVNSPEIGQAEKDNKGSIGQESGGKNPSYKTDTKTEDFNGNLNSSGGQNNNGINAAINSTQDLKTDFSNVSSDESSDEHQTEVVVSKIEDKSENNEIVIMEELQISVTSVKPTLEDVVLPLKYCVDELKFDNTSSNPESLKRVKNLASKLGKDPVSAGISSSEKIAGRKYFQENCLKDKIVINTSSLRKVRECRDRYAFENEDNFNNTLSCTDTSYSMHVPSPCRSHSSNKSSDANEGSTEAEYLSFGNLGTPHLTLPSQARLVYANSDFGDSRVPQSSTQPINYSQPNITISSSYSQGATTTSAPPDSLVSNYRFLYSPEGTSKSTVDSCPSSQSSFRFVYDNGANVPSSDPSGSNMRIVYACAAATAEAPDGDSNRPQKVKLLYAEALGVGTPDDSGQVQLVYTSTAPNQNLVHGPNQHVRIYSPTLITTDNNTNEDNIQMLFAQQSQLEQRSAVPVPVEVLYSGNGTVMAQTVGQPQDLSWIKRDLNQSFVPHITSEALSINEQQQHDKYLSIHTSNADACTNPASTRELANHHNYATTPYLILDSSKQIRHTSPYDTESDGLRTLARAAATRMFSIHADADATTRAAAAIAAVGREAQLKRQLDIIERSRNLPGSALLGRKGENVPHRGPRKRYLSQLTSARK